MRMRVSRGSPLSSKNPKLRLRIGKLFALPEVGRLVTVRETNLVTRFGGCQEESRPRRPALAERRATELAPRVTFKACMIRHSRAAGLGSGARSLTSVAPQPPD